MPFAVASSAVAAPAVAYAAVVQAQAIAGFAKAVVAPVVSIGASRSSGSGGPPPAVAAGASGSGGPSPAVDMPPGSAKSISNELRKAAFGKSHTKGDWGKLWKAVKDRRKHQTFWDQDPEKRLMYSAGGMVRFTKGKTVNPWVAANATDLPTDFTPTEEHKRLAIVDVLLESSAQGEELFEDLKATCALIWGFEGKIDDLMDAFANERAEDVKLEVKSLSAPPLRSKKR